MSTEYVGKMLDGQMHGHGKLIYENDEYYEGDFVRGKKAFSKLMLGTKSVTSLANTSDIMKISVGKRHGQGQYVYADGSTFKGL